MNLSHYFMVVPTKGVKEEAMKINIFSKFKGLGIRILVPTLLLFAAGTGAMLILHFWTMEKVNSVSVNEQGQMLLKTIKYSIEPPMRIGDDRGVTEIVRNLRELAEIFLIDTAGIISYGPSADFKGKLIYDVFGESAKQFEKSFQQNDLNPKIKLETKGKKIFLMGFAPIVNERSCHHCHGKTRELLGAIIVKRDVTGLMAIQKRSNIELLLIALIGLFVAIPVLSWLLNKVAIKPVKELAKRMKSLSSGEADLTRYLDVAAIDCADVMKCSVPECPSYGKECQCWYEVGSFAQEKHCIKITNNEYESCEECIVYQKAVKTEIDEVSNCFNAFILRIRQLIAKITSHANTVQSEVENVESEAESMAQMAKHTRSKSSEVMESVAVTAEVVNGLAAAMEEMTATISEIAQNTNDARAVVQEASDKAIGARDVINNLTKASSKIGDVSRLIASIAEQTNLLALNATIEAARAGEAGKGFAVVANEVKELAKQTSDSTQEIEDVVRKIQLETGRVSEAINKIVEVMQKVAEFSDSVAAAIEEQTATTNEISESALSASKEVNRMTESSKQIEEASTKNAAGADNVKKTTNTMNKLFGELQTLLREFKI